MTTTWRVTHDTILRKITLTVESDDPEVVQLIETAARNAGVELLRDLAPEEATRAES
jgi:hypothetical protein